MRYRLDIDRRNLSDETLLADLAAVAKRLQTESPAIEQYARHGRFGASTIIRRFGTWTKALERAGLKQTRYNAGVGRDEALNDLRRVANELNRPSVTVVEYKACGKFSPKPFLRLFGSWNAAVAAARLEPSRWFRIPDEKLFRNLEQMWCVLGRQPNYGEVEKPFSKFSAGTYASRFGGWRKALEAFVEFANAGETDAPTAEGTVANEASPDAPCRIPGRRSTSRAVNWRLRFLVMQRDGFRCRACGASPAMTPGVKLHVDHILPWSEGGETVLKNLQALCEACNIGKSNVTPGPADD